jgi:uncharacterized membrane protein
MQGKEKANDIYSLTIFKRACYWTYLATACLVLGIVGNILERTIGFTLGLESISWYLITIVFTLISVFHFIIWSVEAKKKA